MKNKKIYNKSYIWIDLKKYVKSWLSWNKISLVEFDSSIYIQINLLFILKNNLIVSKKKLINLDFQKTKQESSITSATKYPNKKNATKYQRHFGSLISMRFFFSLVHSMLLLWLPNVHLLFHRVRVLYLCLSTGDYIGHEWEK